MAADEMARRGRKKSRSGAPRRRGRQRGGVSGDRRRRWAGRDAAGEAEALDGYGDWWDDEHAYIAGFTSGGAAYGIRWEELTEEERQAWRP